MSVIQSNLKNLINVTSKKVVCPPLLQWVIVEYQCKSYQKLQKMIKKSAFGTSVFNLVFHMNTNAL